MTHMATNLPQTEQVVHSLCRAVVDAPSLRVRGPQKGYRCKATYSLTPALVTSVLAQPAVNQLAEAVAEFVSRRSVLTQRFPHFFFEVMTKVNRRGEAMVKIALINEVLSDTLRGEVRQWLCLPPVETTADDTLFAIWLQSDERHALCHFLQQRFPSLVAVVAHVCRHPQSEDTAGGLSAHKPRVMKPDKTCDYVALLPNEATTITEFTPNNFPFQLSADSFCEVNQPMEDAIFEAIKAFLRLDGACPPEGREAFITGRDVNSVIKTFAPFYATVTAATTCPSVFEDTKLNGIDCCEFCHKDALCKPLSAFHDAVSGRGACGERHVLLTAGRHGLHPSTSKALAAMADSDHPTLSDVIYVSCNVHSMSRDLFLLKETLFVAQARTFDFFPGTDYVMTVLHLQPIRTKREGRAGTGSLLVLPIGMPGAGKSVTGNMLRQFFTLAASRHNTQTGVLCATTKSDNKRVSMSKRRRTEQRAKPFVPRTYSDVIGNVSCTVWERDAVFRDARLSGLSLKKAKLSVHAALLAVLAPVSTEADAGDGKATTESWGTPLSTAKGPDDEHGSVPPFQVMLKRRVLYLDSTNGDSEARELYARTFIGGSAEISVTPPSPTQLTDVLELAFNLDTPMTNASILDRVRARQNHPSFPTEPEEQQRKLQAIGAMLSSPGAADTGRAACRVSLDSRGDGEECGTYAQALVAVCAYLWFARSLAQLICPTATTYVREPSAS